MAKITNTETSITIVDNNQVTYVFPKSSLILTQSDISDSINFKLKSTRKTLLTINAKDLGYTSSKEGIKVLSTIIN